MKTSGSAIDQRVALYIGTNSCDEREKILKSPGLRLGTAGFCQRFSVAKDKFISSYS